MFEKYTDFYTTNSAQNDKRKAIKFQLNDTTQNFLKSKIAQSHQNFNRMVYALESAIEFEKP